MTTVTIKEKIEQLRRTIRYHDSKYYVENAPEITDYEYDTLFKELQSLEELHPDLVTSDSPTQRVGGKPVAQFSPVQHKIPMLSIDNTYSEEEIREFDKRIKRMAHIDTHQGIEYVVELKIDGVAITLWYERGLFIRGATRGNGFYGDDITVNLKTLCQIPLKLLPIHKKNTFPSVLEVRGEVYLPNREFQRLNEEREEEGIVPFANPRNAAAGSLKLLDPRITAQRHLQMFAYGIGYTEGIDLKTHIQCLERIQEFGLPTNPYTRLVKNIEEVIRYCNEWDKQRDKLDYMVDGMVIKINNLLLHKQLGATSKAPRWMISFKFQPEQAITKINKIVVQVGKTGTLTPVASLSPVLLAGTTVRRATLHNFDEIRRKDIRVGDSVVVQKAGEIIPQVVAVQKERRNGSETSFKEPTVCPECGAYVSKEDGMIYLRCHNPLCQAQAKRRIQYFAGRNAMDIEGLGPALIEQLVDSNLIKDYADIYALQYDELIDLERMGEKSASNLIHAIETSKHRDLDRLICALGIHNVGSHIAEVLAEHFDNLDMLANATFDTLEKIREIGPVVAKNVVEFFQDTHSKEIIDKLKGRGVNTQKQRTQTPVKNKNISGKSFVLTGTLQKYSRSEAETIIKNLGGQVSSSVSKKTDYVVVGESPGTKLEKAGKLHITVIDEKSFEALLGLDRKGIGQ
ncbi:MAG: NAD-dependent DNA ligase LigA [Candidatus Brocadiaceae bacterium]|nr:NAD-dependent DNA ligase LigA [Candidatus Brocadiaceae bacterium]